MSESVAQPEHVLRLQAIAQTYDVAGLRREIQQAIEGLENGESPYVARKMIEALDMFEDSYVRQHST